MSSQNASSIDWRVRNAHTLKAHQSLKRAYLRYAQKADAYLALMVEIEDQNPALDFKPKNTKPSSEQ